MDELLKAAPPDRPALIWPGGELTYGEFDRLVDVWADRLKKANGAVAVAAVLDPAYAVAFFAILRAGLVAVPLNPWLRRDGLRHELGTVGAGLAWLTAEQVEQLPDHKYAMKLPGIGEPPDISAEPNGHDRPAAAVALFTSGTTGPSKAVLLSAASLTSNAAQTADAHRITGDSVLLNHLPKFHHMHLTAAVSAGATLVLWPAPEPASAIAAANRFRATHLYDIPARLAALAEHPGLDRLELTTCRMIASGGTALPAPAARRLAAHFRIPVIQGYGLAEAGPLTHSERPDAPRPGSVGPVLAGTECRIVDLAAGTPVPAGALGEVQVRGPQVMTGYLNGPEHPIDADGWLSTGDIGRVDADGYLFLVDRIKDVFKCDHELVSPGELERRLAEQPGVRESVVLDVPDKVRGAVPVALVALDGDGGRSTPGWIDHRHTQERLAAAVAAVNAEVPPFQRIVRAELLDRVPRHLTGKPARRELRSWLLAHGTDHERSTPVIAQILTFRVKDDPDEFERLFKAHAEFMRAQPGFIAFAMYRSMGNPGTYVNVGQWQDAESCRAVATSPEFQAHVREFAHLVDVDSDMFLRIAEGGPLS